MAGLPGDYVLQHLNNIKFLENIAEDVLNNLDETITKETNGLSFLVLPSLRVTA